MKVLYLSNGISGAGGLERVLSIKTSFLAENYGYQVTILSLNKGGDDPFYNFSPKVKLVSIPVHGHLLNYVKLYYDGIRNVVKRIKPDIIVVCDDGLKAFFIPLILQTKTPILYERHVSKEIELNHNFPFWKKYIARLKWRLMEYLAPRFNKFVVLTEKNTAEWKRLENLVVIPNPLPFYPINSSALQNKKVIAVGKHSYQKGYDRLLRAWKIVQEKYPNWHLEIYGKMSPENQLSDLARDLNIVESVSFLPPNRDIESSYLDASIYALSSRFEGFGMVLIEAMACGIPCVSFDCNFGPSDIITDGTDGFLVENGNVLKFAQELMKLIDDNDLRVQMGRSAKENVRRFLPETVMEQWQILFEHTIKK
jgi:glycosyltransferase involved in cell wall biosynthesis